MDVWDAFRAAARRWYVFLPLVMVGVAAAALVYVAIPRSFEATDTLLVVGPPGVEAAALNPLTHGPTREGVIRVMSGNEGLKQAVIEAGGSAPFTVTGDDRSGIVTVFAAAGESQQALTTVEALKPAIERELIVTQDRLGVPPASRVRLVSLAPAPEVTTLSDSARTVAAVVVAFSMAIAMGLVVVLELRSRRARARDLVPETGLTPKDHRQMVSARLHTVDARLAQLTEREATLDSRSRTPLDPEPSQSPGADSDSPSSQYPGRTPSVSGTHQIPDAESSALADQAHSTGKRGLGDVFGGSAADSGDDQSGPLVNPSAHASF